MRGRALRLAMRSNKAHNARTPAAACCYCRSRNALRTCTQTPSSSGWLSSSCDARGPTALQARLPSLHCNPGHLGGVGGAIPEGVHLAHLQAVLAACICAVQYSTQHWHRNSPTLPNVETPLVTLLQKPCSPCARKVFYALPFAHCLPSTVSQLQGQCRSRTHANNAW